jgi:hypothetical protein
LATVARTLSGMARRVLSVELDESLVDAVTRTAADEGVAPDEVVGEALKQYFGLRGSAVLDELIGAQGAVVSLSEEEAVALAVAEVRASRAERRAAG